MDPELGERALVDQQREPLARGELVLLVLAGDLLLASAQPRLLAPLVKLLDERAQRRARHQRVRGRALGHVSPPSWSRNGSSTCMAVSVAAIALLLVVGRLERGHLEPHQLAVLEHRVQQVVELVRVEAAGRRNRGGEMLWVEHVEVEVHEDGRSVERVLDRHERLDRARPDHGGGALLEQHALARVEVAHAGEHHPLGGQRLAEPGIPLPRGCRQAHAAEVAAARRARRVEVAVGVQPEDPRVGPVAAHRRERGHGHGAVGSQQHRRVARRQRVVDLAARLEQAAARVAQVVLVTGLLDLAAAADVARLNAQRVSQQRREDLHAARRAGEAIGGAAAQGYERDGHPLIAPSTAARASRRTPSRPPGCPRW